MTASEKGAQLSLSVRLKIREYAEGYKLFEMRRGFGMGREIKATLFFLLAMSMLFMLMQEGFNIARLPVCAVILLICMHMCSYYIFIMPNKAKLMGEHIFKSSRLLGRTGSFVFYKDYFVFKNQYIYLKRYYTELSDCIETDELFVLIGSVENRLTVIPKDSFDETQTEMLSQLLKKEAVKKYRRIKGSKRKNK